MSIRPAILSGPMMAGAVDGAVPGATTWRQDERAFATVRAVVCDVLRREGWRPARKLLPGVQPRPSLVLGVEHVGGRKAEVRFGWDDDLLIASIPSASPDVPTQQVVMFYDSRWQYVDAFAAAVVNKLEQERRR